MGAASMVARCAMVFATGSLLPGCLTQNVQYEPPRNFPPSIEASPQARFPLNSVIVLPDDLVVGADGGIGAESSLTLELSVRDPNLDERLRYRVFVDYDPSLPPGAALENEIPPTLPNTVDRVTRSLTLPVPTSLLAAADACHRIEVIVVGSAGFLEAPRSREPRIPGDLATATFWVATRPEAGGPVDMTECP